MRSPSPTSLTNSHNSEDHIMSKRKSSLHEKAKTPEPKPLSLPFEIPENLAKQVINITNPSDIFSRHHETNDRRLRLLIRRFTNQIQHGCKSPKCTTSTCMSFRKRNARAPLRKYTDVSARALACHLVSEEEPEQHLCKNEPVVPWYEDARHRERRTSSVTGQDGKRQTHQNLDEAATYNPANGNGHVKMPSTKSASDRGPEELVQNHARDEISRNRPSRLSSHPKENQQHFQVHDPSIPRQKKDPKSFAQILYDTLPLRLLDWSPSHWSSGKTSATDSPPNLLSASTEDSTQRSTQENGHVPIPRSPDGDHIVHIDRARDDSDKEINDDCESCSSRLKSQFTPPRSISPFSILNTSVMFSSTRRLDISGLTIPNLSIPVLNWMIRVTKDETNSTSDQSSDVTKDRAAFIDQILFYGIKTPDILLRSLYDWHMLHTWETTTPDTFRMDGDLVNEWLDRLAAIRPLPMILQSLRLSLNSAHVPPPWLHTPSHIGKKRMIQPTNQEHHYMTDDKVAYLCFTCLWTLIWMMWSNKDTGSSDTSVWAFLTAFRNNAVVFPAHVAGRLDQSDDDYHLTNRRLNDVFHLTDALDNSDANRLVESVMQVISVRTAFAHMAMTRLSKRHGKKTRRLGVPELIIHHLRHLCQPKDLPNYIKINTVLLWIRTLILNHWDGKPVVPRAGPIGGALQLMAILYSDRGDFGLEPEKFHVTFIADRLDGMEMPVEWLTFRPSNQQIHLLSHSFLFKPKMLVAYFRAINYAAMSKSSADARLMQFDVRKFGNGDEIPVYGADGMMQTLRPHMAPLFVLTVRRDNVLEDAINQIWRRQRRELLRPLKVRMGMDEGEQGVDIGGVQQEFFRIAFAQAIDPGYGMFTVDDTTRMTWFQPMSVEPLYKFEVLGILMSIAVYNSITLPITFPIAFYRKLLGLKVKKLGHIRDGWPDLVRGLQEMLDWSDGDVSDVFVRSYAFSFEAYGNHTEVNMEKIYRDTPWPPTERKKGKEKAKTASFEIPDDDEDTTATSLSSCSSSASLVTNQTRDAYVKDYIFWLTDKSIRPQYEALARGFHTCLDRTALSIFTPEALQSVIEGHTTIDLNGLERATKYEDGFDPTSDTVRDFWHVVRSFTPYQHKRLLEFVTASDRVPVNGIESVQFVIQRNGFGDERLPTSMTCFGRLLLPEYSSREAMEEMLSKAIENAEGFGVA